MNERLPLTRLFADLWRETAELVREEAALAKAELAEKGTKAGLGLAWLAVGGAIVLVGVLFLLVAVTGGLAVLLPEEHAPWLAPLIVGLVIVPTGLVVVAKGLHSLTPSQLKPTQSARSVRKDVEVLKEHMQ